MAATEKEIQAFQKYLSTRKIVIADEGSSSRAGITQIFMQLGVKMSQITLASSFSEAAQAIVEKQPDIVIAEYNFGKSSGLELLQSQREANPDVKKTLFVLLTSNGSQTAVARAAEEDIDAFILKPFTPEVLRATLIRTAVFKLNPPEYIKVIEQGKALLTEGNLEEAEKVFGKAVDLDPKPSLALFYLGQVHSLRKMTEISKGEYEKGLQFNRIHYKCMVGLYELLMSLKLHGPAYEVVQKISRYFPANPKRLTEVLRLAIINKKYDDVERYYQVFCDIDTRNDILVNYICAALVVCAKYYFQTGNRSRALELCQKAAATSAGKEKIIREIVLTLLDAKIAGEAEKFLGRYPLDQRQNPEFRLLDLEVRNGLMAAPAIIDLGRKLVAENVVSPRLFEILVTRALEMKAQALAENLMHDGVSRFPELKERLSRLF